MSTIIKLRCIDQVLTFESTPVIASGGMEEDRLQVSFCSKWDGLARTAVFWRTEDDAFHVPLDQDDNCVIPAEVLADEGVFYFGLFGVSPEGRQRTTEVIRYTVKKGAITSGTKPPDPTPDVYTQLLTQYAETQAIAQQAVSSASASASAAAASAKAAEASAKSAAQAVPATREVNGKPLSADINLTASDIGAAPELRASYEKLGVAGWYRIATISGTARANDTLVMLGSSYYQSEPEGVSALVCANAHKPSIVILNASGDSVFDQLRVVKAGDSNTAIEVHYGVAKANDVSASVISTRFTYHPTLHNFVASTATEADVLLTQSVKTTPSGNVLTTGMDPAAFGAVPTTRKVNNKKLDTDIALTAADVGARPDTWTPSASAVGAVPEKRGTASLSSVGWYRLATFTSQTRTNIAMVMLGNNYANNKIYPQGVTALVSVNKNQPSIVILSSSESNVFSKLRLVNISTSHMALEAYYAATNTNTVYSALFGIRTADDFTADAFAASTATDAVLEQDIATIPSGNVLTDHRTFMYRKLLTASDDLDDFIEDGTFVYNTNAAPANAPFPNASVGICFGSGSTINQRVQLVMRYGATGYMKFRGYTGSAWTPWADVYTNINHPTVSGSYEGTGTYGEANPSTLTFPFTPKLIVFYGPLRDGDASARTASFIVLCGVGTYSWSRDGLNTYTRGNFSVNDNTASWYTTNLEMSYDPETEAKTDPTYIPYGQMNGAGKTYHYVAFG